MDEAVRFVRETGCDWLSVSIGNIHGAVVAALRDQPKGESRLNLQHLETLHEATGVPIVLHGGSGVKHEDVLAGMKSGIAKVNVGFEIRKAYEDALKTTEEHRRRQGGGLQRAPGRCSGIISGSPGSRGQSSHEPSRHRHRNHGLQGRRFHPGGPAPLPFL